MSDSQSDRRKGSARARHDARNRRREPMVRPLDPNAPPRTAGTPPTGAASRGMVTDPRAETQPYTPTSGDLAETQRNARAGENAPSIPLPPNMAPPPPLPRRLPANRPGSHVAQGAARGAARAAMSAARAVETVDWTGVRRGGERAVLVARDSVWYARRNPRILFGVVMLMVLAAAGWLTVYFAGQRLFPGVSTMGLSMGSLTADEAAAELQRYWTTELHLTLRDGDRTWDVSPTELGLRLDVQATVKDMRRVGLAGIPFGYSVLPTVSMDVLTTQNRLLEISEQAQVQPSNAGYRWEGEILIGVEGTEGRYLDVPNTLDALQQTLPQTVSAGVFDLVMTTVAPDVVDPDPYMDDVRALVANTFILNGYDPFTNEYWAWATDRTTFVSWLEAGQTSLTLRELTFAPFVAQQTSVLQRDNPLRYLEPTETINAVREAIQTGQTSVNLRVRYQPSQYEVQPGDSGYRIATRTGIPFGLVAEANPGNPLDELYPGEIVNLPSRDETLPHDIIPSKRVIVDIDTQSLVAFEGNNVVFAWLISTGMYTAPTYPGVFQILSHVDLATGSSYELCGADTCGTWDMYWFMGIYEVVPGLVNGFHGAVVLPDGRYLGGGNVGSPFTYGCVMSQNDNAELLYRWADEGTIVEIISSQFDPQSDLGRHVRDGTWRQLPVITPGSTTAETSDDVAGAISL
ncbi:MAG: L,D-transpeptidase family protein [Anaerolineae bacterium]